VLDLTGGSTRIMRRTVVILTTAILLVLASSPAGFAAGVLARPPSSYIAAGAGFTFYGSGDGHGLGMSQWGAYGLAQMGWSYRQILTHFYARTAVTAPAPVKRIRVGLTWDRRSIHLTAELAPVRLWLDAPLAGTPVASIPVGQTWRVSAARTGYAIHDATGALIGGRTWGGSAHDLFATFADRGGRVFVPESDAVYGKGFSYAHGYLEFNEYGCPSACLERLVLPVGFESYLRGIGEMPASWPMEALRAQAVAARTFAAHEVTTYGRRSYCNCDVTDGANDQTYVGYAEETGAVGARWVNAVTTTVGQMVTYHGAPILAVFAASDGGHTENVEDAWHDGNPAYAIAYLRGVCDPGENTAANPWTNWHVGFTIADTTSRLAPYTGSIGRVTGFASVVRGTGGGIVRLTVRGASGSSIVTGTELRAALGLPDDRAWIDANLNITGSIRTEYDRKMCGPGLPAAPIGSWPGGARQRFVHGSIYRNDAAALTVWLRGPLYLEYVAQGGAFGHLGLPTSRITKDGSGGLRATFEHGWIDCPAVGTCTTS
jgi:SpoIID/LytB domain protein